MRFERVIREKLRRSDDAGNVVADVNAVIAANVGERGARTSTSSSSKVRIVQRAGQPASVTEEQDTDSRTD